MKTLTLRDKDLAVLRRTFRRFPYVREARYEFDVVRTECTQNPRLMQKIARDGIAIYPESTSS